MIAFFILLFILLGYYLDLVINYQAVYIADNNIDFVLKPTTWTKTMKYSDNK